MARHQIEVNGALVDLRPKADLMKNIAEMLQERTDMIKAGGITTNKLRKEEVATVSFFGSILHYLDGGVDL
ncbi:MAG: hypothetical protein ACXVAY_01545 [Mucilaginibacter sp.]